MVGGHALTEDNTPTHQREASVLLFKFDYFGNESEKSSPLNSDIGKLRGGLFQKQSTRTRLECKLSIDIGAMKFSNTILRRWLWLWRH